MARCYEDPHCPVCARAGKPVQNTMGEGNAILPRRKAQIPLKGPGLH